MTVPRPSGAISLRVSTTDRCGHRCRYCVPREGAGPVDVGRLLSFEQITRFARFVRDRFGLSKVHLTGGEPLARPGLARLIALLSALEPADLALTTNGVDLAPLAETLAQAGLRRVNVSLDTIRPDRFAWLTGGDLAQVLAGLDAAQAAGLTPIKINTTVLRGFNDSDVVEIARLALRRHWRVRFLELMPIGSATERFEEWFVPAETVRARLAEAFCLRQLPVVPGASSVDFRADSPETPSGVIGFIRPCTSPFCGTCRRLRLTSRGLLIGCLARGEGLAVGPLLTRNDADAERALAVAIGQALATKRTDTAFSTARLMRSVGG